MRGFGPFQVWFLEIVGMELTGVTIRFGAYKQNQEGKLDWKVAGLWAGAVGLFGAGDYYLSK